MAKKEIGKIKLQIPAGKATPSPPIGPALGQRGLNIMNFCKEFNAATQNIEPDTPIPTIITAYADKSFSFIMKSPPVTYFLKQAVGIKKGSSEVGKKDAIATITMKQIKEIAEKKMNDLNANDITAACQMIIGSAMSMGIKVIDKTETADTL